jgi:two-component system sensor histidine kinase MprB
VTLRAKMALALALLAGLAALLVGVTTYLATEQRVRAEVDGSLKTQAENLSDTDGNSLRLYCASGGTSITQRGDRPGEGFERLGGVVSQCLDADGQVVAYSGAVALPVDSADQRLAANGGRVRTRTVSLDGVTYRVTTVPIDYSQSVGAVQLARDFSESQRVLDALRLWIGVVIVVVSGIGALAGWLIARKATKPLVQLTDAAEEVASSGRLDVDVPPAGNDEPGRLARAFATMLSALGQSREQQQQLVQDAGHELRTPLTSLRTNVETLRRYDNLPEATRQAILSDLEIETRELGSLVDELVQLATDTYDDEPEQTVAFDHVVDRVAERVRRRTGRTITVESTPSSVIGKPRDLARAIGNLVDNAAKFSEAPTPVEVTLDHGTVTVRDHGPGVPKADLDQIFKRFYRSPESRSKPGSGLGLSIVEQTARSHGGTVTVVNAPDGGAVFTFSLPEAPPPPPPAV